MHYLEKEIINNIKSGNEKAFEYLFKTYFDKLINYAKEILKNHDVAEEIVEDIFVKLWENRENVVIESSIQAYLYKSTYNACLNHFKHVKVENKYKLFFYNHILPEKLNDQHHQYPLSDIITDEFDLLVQKAINNLPEKCKEIFIMSRHDELNNNEIAQKLKISVNTVKTQISRALNKLHALLKELNMIIC
jgi:RNA polymerase sigma-70 factor, ECF subfamily